MQADELAEIFAQRLDPRAGNARVVFERAREALRFGAQLPVEIGDLRLEFLDARVVVEQGRGLFRELAAQGRELLAQPPDQFRIEEIRGFERLARFERVADEFGLGLCVGLLRARGGKLRIEFA